MAPQAITYQQRLNELISGLIEDCMNPEALLGRNGTPRQRTRQLVERMLQTEGVKSQGCTERR